MLGVVVLKSSQGQASSCQLMFGTNRLYASNTRCLFPHSLCVCHTLLPHSLTHCRAFYHSILHLFHPSHFMLLQSVLSPRQPPTVITSVISWLMNCALMSPWNNFTGLYFNYLFILFLFFFIGEKVFDATANMLRFGIYKEIFLANFHARKSTDNIVFCLQL